VNVKRIGRHIIIPFCAVLGALLCAVLASCASDELALTENGGTATGDTATVQICFTLSVDGKTATRAGTWGDDYNSPDVNDVESKIKDLQVLVLPDKELTGKNHPHAFLLENLTYNGDLVTGRLSMPDSLLTDEGKFVGWIEVFANCLANRDTIEIKPLYKNNQGNDAHDNCCLEHSKGNTLTFWNGFNTMWYESVGEQGDAIQAMPMWGFLTIKSDDDISPIKGTLVNVGEIPLLRSLAKIKVSLSNDDIKKEYSLESVEIRGYDHAPFVAPNFWKKGDSAYKSVSELPIEETLHAVSQKTDWWIGNYDQDGVFSLKKESDNCYYTYISEMWNYNPGEGNTKNTITDYPSCINLKYKIAGEEKEASFKIGDYNADGEFVSNIDVIRNTVYDYTVSVSGSDVNVSLTTLPWNVASSSIGWYVKGESALSIDAALYAWQEGQTKEVDSKTYYYNVIPDPTDATVGDTEARYCYVSYPRYESFNGGENNYVSDNYSTADFYLLVTAPEGAVWKAELSNTEDFALDVSDATAWECATANGTSKLYSVATGIARANKESDDGTKKVYCRPYKISVKPIKPWYKIPEDAKPAVEGEKYYTYNTNWENDKYPYTKDDGTEATGTWDEIYGETSGPYTDLYITVSTSGKESDKVYVPINPLYNLSEITSYYMDSNKKRYRFAQNDQTGRSIRIWQLKATNKKNSEMASDNKGNKFFTTNAKDATDE